MDNYISFNIWSIVTQLDRDITKLTGTFYDIDKCIVLTVKK